MKTFNKQDILSMYKNSNNQEYSNDYVNYCNTIIMKDSDNEDIEVILYSDFINQNDVLDMIRDDIEDSEHIYNECYFEAENKIELIDCDVSDEAYEELENIQKEFNEVTKEYSIQHIQYIIDNRDVE